MVTQDADRLVAMRGHEPGKAVQGVDRAAAGGASRQSTRSRCVFTRPRPRRSPRRAVRRSRPPSVRPRADGAGGQGRCDSRAAPGPEGTDRRTRAASRRRPRSRPATRSDTPRSRRARSSWPAATEWSACAMPCCRTVAEPMSRIRRVAASVSHSGTTASATGAARVSARRSSGSNRSSSAPASSSRHQNRTGWGARSNAAARMRLRRHRYRSRTQPATSRAARLGAVERPGAGIGSRPGADPIDRDRERGPVHLRLAHPFREAECHEPSGPLLLLVLDAAGERHQHHARARRQALDDRVVAGLGDGHLAAAHQGGEVRPMALQRAAGRERSPQGSQRVRRQVVAADEQPGCVAKARERARVERGAQQPLAHGTTAGADQHRRARRRARRRRGPRG